MDGQYRATMVIRDPGRKTCLGCGKACDGAVNVYCSDCRVGPTGFKRTCIFPYYRSLRGNYVIEVAPIVWQGVKNALTTGLIVEDLAEIVEFTEVPSME